MQMRHQPAAFFNAVGYRPTQPREHTSWRTLARTEYLSPAPLSPRAATAATHPLAPVPVANLNTAPGGGALAVPLVPAQRVCLFSGGGLGNGEAKTLSVFWASGRPRVGVILGGDPVSGREGDPIWGGPSVVPTRGSRCPCAGRGTKVEAEFELSGFGHVGGPEMPGRIVHRKSSKRTFLSTRLAVRT
jgi:hypothetical protein